MLKIVRNSRRWRYCLLLAALCAPPAVAGEAVAVHGDSVLWRVQRDGAHAGYLFGTMHSDAPRVMELPGKVRRAFENSRRLAVEMQLTPETVRETMRLMLRDDDTTLRGAVGEASYERAVAALAGRDIDESTANRFKTWAVMMTLIVPPNDSGTFLDMKLQQLAAESDMAVHGLESPREQLGAFDRLDAAEQERLLEMALDLLHELDALYEAVTDAYLEEDLNRILRLSRQGYAPEDKALHDKLMRLLIDKRNRTMVENMAPLLEQGDAFVAVGALHLPGEAGIVSRLKRRGYEVEAIRKE